MDFKQPPRRKVVPQEDTNQPTNATESNPPAAIEAPPEETPTIELDMSLDEAPKSDYHLSPAHMKSNRKKKLIIIGGIAAFLIAIAGIWWVFGRDTAPLQQSVIKNSTKKVTVKPKPTSPLTGATLTEESLATRTVTGVMIENSPDARPQSGLLEAGQVYEAIAEGGVTRFMAVYQEDQPQYIGPVRSARAYYLDYILPLSGSYAHAGGSPEALSDIKTLGVRDLDQFANGGAYERISSRAAPHNLYTSFAKLDELNKAKSFTYSKITGFERKRDVPQTPTARTIDISLSGPTYSPRFEYDQATNTYKRFQAGEAHTDQKSGKQIMPKTVVALVVNRSSSGYYSSYATSGTGKVYVFQDGIVSEGTWAKKDRKSPLVLTDKNGLPLKLNTGQTWITLAASPSDVSYRP